MQHGAAGVLAALVGVAPHAEDPDQLQDTIARTSRWIQRRLPAEPRLLPGLYSGRSGTAWALHDAATLLGDRQLAAAAVELAARVPVDWPAPGIAHGLAGAGMAQLHLWQSSGDQRFGPRVRACADGLVRAARRTGVQVGWPIPGSIRSRLTGETHYGYAHGTAGIGAFLLAAGAATGEARYTELACQAADTLADAAVRQAGAARWPTGPGRDALAGIGWCTGSAGIGAFLLRAWQVTGERRLLDLARAAAMAVHQARGRCGLAACHGLSGGGHLLLDLCGVLEEPAFRGWAEDLARVMAARTVRRGSLLLVPDETGLGVVAGYGAGVAGVLAFLTRLRHGGRSPWMIEPGSARTMGRASAGHLPPATVPAAAIHNEITDRAALPQLPAADPS